MKRRDFVNGFLGTSLVGAIITLAYPVIRFLIPPRQAEAVVKRAAVAKTSELPPNTSRVVKFGSQPAMLVATPGGDILAFAATCTHLACTVIYEPDTESLFCPCHNGRFDLAGNVLAGPPPGPLETFQVELAGGDIVISRRS